MGQADKMREKQESMSAHDEMHTKAPSSIFLTARVRNWYCSTSCRHYTGLARAKITRDIFNPEQVGVRAVLNSKQAKHTN